MNACNMCLADEETVDDLLLRCKVTHALWSHAFSDGLVAVGFSLILSLRFSRFGTSGYSG